MRVLCIEDQESKFKLLNALLEGAFGAEVIWARTVSASLSLIAESWDLIALDMNFPAAGPQGRAINRSETSGIRVLQVMSAQNIKVPVIIATAYDRFIDGKNVINGLDELDRHLKVSFPDMYKGVVRVERTSDAWQHSLIALIREQVL